MRACFFASLPARLHACMHACLPAHPPVCLCAYVPCIYLPAARLLTCMLACPPSYSLHASLHAKCICLTCSHVSV
jgi:hypothetical protein